MISFLINVRQPIRILIVVMYVCCIAALSLLPMNDLPHIPTFPGFDKLVHFCMYFVFSTLFGWALKTEHNYSWLFLIVPVTVSWGIFMEFMQKGMHLGRNFELRDIFANSMGVCFGLLFYMIVANYYSKVK
jgi:VanZ family protein